MYMTTSMSQLLQTLPCITTGHHSVLHPLPELVSEGIDTRFLNDSDDTDDDFKYNMCIHTHFHNIYTYLQMTEFNDISKTTWAIYVLETLCDMNSIALFNVLKGGLLDDDWTIDNNGNIF